MEKSIKKYKILLVEDDKFITKAYVDGLSRTGFVVTAASDGNQALIALKQDKPDLVLLDLIMPEKNGFETLAEIKADESLKDIPVVVVSNLGQDSDIVEAKKLGAIDYLIKSDYSIDEVAKKIRQYLK